MHDQNSQMVVHQQYLCGISLPTASHSSSQARPRAPTTRSKLAGPNAADTDGNTSMAAAEPKYMPAVGRRGGGRKGRTRTQTCP